MRLVTALVLTGIAAQAQMVYTGGTAQRSFLGVGVAEITAERAKALRLKEERGIEVTRVEEDSPAAKAGIKVQDVVLDYQGQRVEGGEQFVRLVRETPPGREVKLLISRGGQTQTVTAVIAGKRMKMMEIGDMQIAVPHIPEMPEARSRDMPVVIRNWRTSALGVEAEALNSQLAEFFGVKEGVLIRSVGKGSAAEKAGLKAGDVMVKVDEHKVTSPMDVTQAIRSLENRKSFPVSIVRDKKETTVTVILDEDADSARPRGRAARLQEF